MAEANGDGGGSHRDAARQRPRVQQLRPTNKDVPVQQAAPTAQSSSKTTVTESPGAAAASVGGNSAGPVGQPKVVPRIVTGQGSGSTILVNNCQVRETIRLFQDE
jgi:hypothetical protein